MSNIKNICRQHHTTFKALEFELEVSVAEEMLDCDICSSEQFSFLMCLESGDGSRTFH